MHHASGICEWPVTIYLTNSNIYLLQILFYYFYYNTVYSVCCRYTSCNLKEKQGSNCLLSMRRKWFLFIHIMPGNILLTSETQTFWKKLRLSEKVTIGPSFWMNFFSLPSSLHEFFFLAFSLAGIFFVFPPPPSPPSLF